MSSIFLANAKELRPAWCSIGIDAGAGAWAGASTEDVSTRTLAIVGLTGVDISGIARRRQRDLAVARNTQHVVFERFLAAMSDRAVVGIGEVEHVLVPTNV
jgi:hypothetical protein